MTKFLTKNTLSIWEWVNDILAKETFLHLDLLFIKVKIWVIRDKHFIYWLPLSKVELFEQVLAENGTKTLFFAQVKVNEILISENRKCIVGSHLIKRHPFQFRTIRIKTPNEDFLLALFLLLGFFLGLLLFLENFI